MAPPMSTCVADAQQVLDDVDLVRDFRSAEDGHERTLRLGDRVGEVLDFLGHQEPDDLGLAAHGLGHGVHRGVFAVAGAEGVVAVDVGHCGQGLGELRVPLLFAGIETQVFQHQDAAAGRAVWLWPGRPGQSYRSANSTCLPSSSPSRTAVGRMLYLAASLGAPLGRPRWLIRISAPPRSSTDSIDGRAMRIRVSSVMHCLSSKGTLKSTRISTFLFLTSTS